MQNDNSSNLIHLFNKLLVDEKIEANQTLSDNFEKFYLPLANWVNEQHDSTPIIIGINGAQGSGKSTLSKILSELLQHGFDKKVATLSIDDLYKTQQQRTEMAKSVHPLFKTRGVPGTHDIELGISLLTQLKQQTGKTLLPVFDKALDDRKHKIDWQTVNDKVDIVLFEGWCVGSVAEEEHMLTEGINELEKTEDQLMHWRQYANQQLSGDYQQLFSLIDKLIMLKIPAFEKVVEWRTLQEDKLSQTSNKKAASQTMSSTEIRHFIMHFERITRHTLREMPQRADVVLDINDNHQIHQLTLIST